MKMIPYGKQSIEPSDIAGVARVLRSAWVTQGPMVEKFENALARYCGVKYAVAVSSGTAALHLACLAAGLKKGDEAVTSPITFLASANCMLYAGAKPVFADINPETYNIDPQTIRKVLTRKTKVLLPVHFSGLPCEMGQMAMMAKKRGLTVIEDACHALGASYKANGIWAKVGSCRHSQMTVFSFHPVKHITTGEGGAITTNDRKIYEKLLALRNHGIYKDSRILKQKPWYYEMRDLGFNYRITDFQSALGLSQLRRLNQFVARRRQIAKRYTQVFRRLNHVVLPIEEWNTQSSYHLYILRLDFKALKTNRTAVMEELKRRGIGTQVHYIPLYRQPYYQKRLKPNPKNFAHAEKYYHECLSIPLYASMSDQDVSRVIHAVSSIVRRKP